MTKNIHIHFYAAEVSFHLHQDRKRIKFIRMGNKKQETSKILISNVVNSAIQLVYDIVTPSLTHLTT